MLFFLFIPLRKIRFFFYFMRGFFFSRFSISAKKKRKIFNILQNARPIINLPAALKRRLMHIQRKSVGRLTRLNKKFLAEKVVKILFAPLLKKGKKKRRSSPDWERFGAESKAITSQSLQVPTAPIRTTFPRRQIQNRLCLCACRGIGAYCSLCTFCPPAGLRRL